MMSMDETPSAIPEESTIQPPRVSKSPMDSLRQLMDDLGPHAVANLLRLILDEHPGRTSELIRAMDDQLAAEFVSHAHTIASTSRLVGAEMLTSLCIQAENLGLAAVTPLFRANLIQALDDVRFSVANTLAALQHGATNATPDQAEI